MSTFVYEPDLQFLDNSCTRQGEGIEIDPTAEIHPNVSWKSENWKELPGGSGGGIRR